MNTGKRIRIQFGSLDTFFTAVLTLFGDIPRATQLEDSCLTMWNRYGIEPELFDYATAEAVSPEYLLRPEIIESAYYLYHFTRNEKYLSMEKMFFDGLHAYCRTDAGLTSVVTKAKADRMESYLLVGNTEVPLPALRSARNSGFRERHLQHRGAPDPKNVVIPLPDR